MPKSSDAVTAKMPVATFARGVGASSTSTRPETTARGKVPAWIQPRSRGLTVSVTCSTRLVMASTVIYGRVTYEPVGRDSVQVRAASHQMGDVHRRRG